MTVKYSLPKILLYVINYVAFYLIWVGCFYAALHGLSFVAACSVAFYLVIHLLFVSAYPWHELLLILSLILLGSINDMVVTLSGLLTYVDASSLGISWWMVGIWGCFGSTYWHAFSWLESRPFLSSILGALAVPFCYLWGVEAHVATFQVSPKVALVLIGILWAILLPVSFFMSKTIKSRTI